MFGKFGKMMKRTRPCKRVGEGLRRAPLLLLRIRVAFLFVMLVLQFLPLCSQPSSLEVVIGHNRLAFKNAVRDCYGYFEPPYPYNTYPLEINHHCLNFTRCRACLPPPFQIPPFPYSNHGIIMWINDDSGWRPEGWEPLRVPNGTGPDGNKVEFQGRLFRVYLLSHPGDEYEWRPSSRFVFVPYPDSSIWEQGEKVERDLIIYIDEYGYYWQLCRSARGFDTGGIGNGGDGGGNEGGGSEGIRCESYTCCPSDDSSCWVQREGWDGTPDLDGHFGRPDLCGRFFLECRDANGRRIELKECWICVPRGNGAKPLFSGKVTTVPISPRIPQSADASVDTRPVCPSPEQPPTYANFGDYTYLGGLFVGQVPWHYNSRRDRQTSPDLSGTGRTLLKFHNPDGFPTQPTAACLSLLYTAIPDGVYTSSLQTKPIGVRLLSQVDWEESTASWRLMQNWGLDTPFTDENTGWLSSTKVLTDDKYEPIRPTDEYNPVYNEGHLIRFGERCYNAYDQCWERNHEIIKRVVIPLEALQFQHRTLLSLLLALYPEEQFNNPKPIWYYFMSKEHPLASGKTYPRLWFVVREQGNPVLCGGNGD